MPNMWIRPLEQARVGMSGLTLGAALLLAGACGGDDDITGGGGTGTGAGSTSGCTPSCGTGYSCVDGSCALPGAGEVCDLDVGCQDDLLCAAADEASDPVCVLPGDVGTPCVEDADCAQLACADDVCVAVDFVDLGFDHCELIQAPTITGPGVAQPMGCWVQLYRSIDSFEDPATADLDNSVLTVVLAPPDTFGSPSEPDIGWAVLNFAEGGVGEGSSPLDVTTLGSIMLGPGEAGAVYVTPSGEAALPLGGTLHGTQYSIDITHVDSMTLDVDGSLDLTLELADVSFPADGTEYTINGTATLKAFRGGGSSGTTFGSCTKNSDYTCVELVAVTDGPAGEDAATRDANGSAQFQADCLAEMGGADYSPNPCASGWESSCTNVAANGGGGTYSYTINVRWLPNACLNGYGSSQACSSLGGSYTGDCNP